MYLPDRVPVLLNFANGDLEEVPETRMRPASLSFPWRVQLARTCDHPGQRLPGEIACEVAALFSYGAVGWRRGKFRSAAIVVDREPRQDLRRMPPAEVRAGVKTLRRRMPANRLSGTWKPAP